MATSRIERRDRTWVDAGVTVLCGPFDMPSTDALRRAVTALAESHPHSRLTWTLDRSNGRWRTGRDVESIVVERDWDDARSVGTVLDALEHDAELAPPLTLVRYPDHLGLKMSHGIGDGAISLAIVASVLHTAVTGQVMPWPARPAGRIPLARAACRTFGRHPALVGSAIRDRSRPAAQTRPSAQRAWRPSSRAIYTVIDPARTRQIRTWRAEFAPQSSRFGLQAALLLKALRRVGLDVAPDVRLIVDLRRYLGAGFIDGNFVAGVPMRMDWRLSPTQITALVRATTASGRPLATQMMTALRVGKAVPAPTSMTPDEPARLTFSYFGQAALIENLPYRSGHQPVYAGSVAPDGPWGVTFLHAEYHGATAIATTFHDNVIDPALMEKAMDLVASEPVALLGEGVAP